MTEGVLTRIAEMIDDCVRMEIDSSPENIGPSDIPKEELDKKKVLAESLRQARFELWEALLACKPKEVK